MLSFSGPARVFDSEEQATEAIEANRIPEGSVVVIRFEGPKGGPGMREMHRIAGAFLGRRIAVVTDGRFSGATGGLSVGYLSPEAAQDGEIACIENGDEIAIDVMKRTIEARVDERTIKERMRAFHPGGRPEGTRILKEFARRVGSTFEGALREEK
jgi:dihydroxy-acid dehydratase